jgi:hypothetical protein
MTQATCEAVPSPQAGAPTSILTTAAVAERLGVPLWWLRSMIHRKVLVPPAKLGPTFVWTAADLPRVRQALAAEGYLPNGGK